MLLAKAGLDVKMIERIPRVGGRTSTIEAQGFRFDMGPTFFLYPPVLEQIFADVGYDLRREVELVRLDPQYRLVFGDGATLDAVPDVARMEAAMAQLSPRDASAVWRFLADNREKFGRFKMCLCGCSGAQCGFCPCYDIAGAGPLAPPLDESQDCSQALFVFDVYALSGVGRP